MDELVKMVVSKTGMSESMAKTVVEIVVTQIKKKLPAGIGSQVETLLGDSSSKDTSKSSGNPLGGLMDNLGEKFGKK